MKASELRIGNIAEFCNVGIPTGKFLPVDGADISHFEEGYLQLMPIPMSEEWLLKFGFEVQPLRTQHGNGQDWTPEYPKTEYLDYVLRTKDIDRPCIVTYEVFYWINKDGGIEKDEPQMRIAFHEIAAGGMGFYGDQYNHVHLFQNLFNIITGEELELKPS